ncbi:MAG: circadian clock KaiB family protein [Thermosynechococcaceae cyanobacterium]
MTPHLPQLYKGLALITPGGDFVYAIDPSKQQHWHAQLCSVLQQQFDLPESPLFLTPAYTATVDRWIDPRSQALQVVAETYPKIWRYRVFLQAIFEVPIQQWKIVPSPSDDAVESYRSRFPQLWESHNLVLRADAQQQQSQSPDSFIEDGDIQGYVFHLFIAGSSRHTTRTLEVLHEVLEQALTRPYTLKIIDVIQHPDQAETAQILATPTLVRVWPQPIQRVVGTLENPQKILQLLML